MTWLVAVVERDNRVRYAMGRPGQFQRYPFVSEDPSIAKKFRHKIDAHKFIEINNLQGMSMSDQEWLVIDLAKAKENFEIKQMVRQL